MDIKEILKKAREPRICGITIFDTGLTILSAIIITNLFKGGLILFIIILLFLMSAGVLAHIVTKTPTQLNYFLGLSDIPKK